VLIAETLHNGASTAGRSPGADDGRPERENMREYKITAANKEHFESLIKDYRKAGFMLITLGNRVAELETDEEFIFIEY
jgi:BRCT domain type II-containing protein